MHSGWNSKCAQVLIKATVHSVLLAVEGEWKTGYTAPSLWEAHTECSSALLKKRRVNIFKMS